MAFATEHRKSPPPALAISSGQHLHQNAALGQSPEFGDTPVIQRKRQKLFSNTF
jgi:hypothetical protein